MKSLTMKILVPALLALLLAMALLGTLLVGQVGGIMARQVEANAGRTADFVASVSLPYVTNYDLTALGGFVKEITRGGDVAYAEFFGADGASLTADVAPPAKAGGQLLLIERVVKDAQGKPLARFRMGMPKDAIAQAQRDAVWSVVAGIVMVALAVSASIVFVVRRALAPAGTMQALLAELARGNLTMQAQAGSRDEIGDMARSLNLAVTELNGTLVKVGSHAVGMDLAARDISGAVGAHAATASEVAATVVEITSSMEELSATSTLIADHSKAVVDIANSTLDNARKGSEAMQEVLSKMDEIRAENQLSLGEIVALGGKSKEISKVMVMISAVADQTKLIAFNAALEASSAGEAGRRFGVVAGEIRRLADSVSDSTGEIDAKISEIQDSISRLVITSEKGAKGIVDGMGATARTAQRLDQLVQAASQTSGAAQQISLSTQQQKSASSQVVQALREIVNASDDNARSIARIAQISEQMNDTSSRLSALVGQFRLSGTAGTS